MTSPDMVPPSEEVASQESIEGIVLGIDWEAAYRVHSAGYSAVCGALEAITNLSDNDKATLNEMKNLAHERKMRFLGYWGTQINTLEERQRFEAEFEQDLDS